MRTWLVLLFLAIPISSYATTKLQCYSFGKLIYSGEGKDLAYSDGMIFIKEVKTNHVVMSNADCVLVTSLIK